MKKKSMTLVLVALFVVLLVPFPPLGSHSQDQASEKLPKNYRDPIGIPGISMKNAQLVDSFYKTSERIALKLDTVQQALGGGDLKSQYVITDYEAPIAVLRIPVQGADGERFDMLVRWDSTDRVFHLKQITTK